MEELMGYCGLLCATCPIYVATREEDKQKQARRRAEIARSCHEHYGLNYSADDITDCDGCRGGGRLFQSCASCRVRQCARERAVQHCGACADYPCSELTMLFASDPGAKARLEALRTGS